MQTIIDWFSKNFTWIFSGIGVFVIGYFTTNKYKTQMVRWFKIKRFKINGNNNTVLIGSDNSNNSNSTNNTGPNSREQDPIEHLKLKIQILFIDDQEFGKDILQANGWILTEHIKDVENIGDPNVLKSHIIFVDIRGVGKKLFPKEEGKGLAIELKRRYNNKKIILYSAEDPESLVDAHRKVDFILRKAAEPMQYITLVEDYAKEITL